jgi:methylated-DNA-[protein]-cysteine S-methyltransferase
MNRQLSIKSKLGPLFLVASPQGLRGVYWEKQREPLVEKATESAAATHLFEAAEQIESYLLGERRSFELSLDIEGTPFQREVWAELQKIPYGVTLSYKELAIRLNKPKAFRAVGTANGRNPLTLIIPCHRVIASDASLGGYSGGLDRKSWLLRLESV